MLSRTCHWPNHTDLPAPRPPAPSGTRYSVFYFNLAYLLTQYLAKTYPPRAPRNLDEWALLATHTIISNGTMSHFHSSSLLNPPSHSLRFEANPFPPPRPFFSGRRSFLPCFCFVTRCFIQPPRTSPARQKRKSTSTIPKLERAGPFPENRNTRIFGSRGRGSPRLFHVSNPPPSPCISLLLSPPTLTLTPPAAGRSKQCGGGPVVGGNRPFHLSLVVYHHYYYPLSFSSTFPIPIRLCTRYRLAAAVAVHRHTSLPNRDPLTHWPNSLLR